MSESPNRRSFLASAGLTVAAVLTPRLAAQPPDKPKIPPPGVIIPGIRENVAGMNADHPTLGSYRKAIEAMSKRDKADPLSWQFQANMHGTNDNGNAADWNWCMHSNWYFLPWHRGYIYFFEKIVRKLSGDDKFRLPYWGWEQPGDNVLPTPFRDAQYKGQKNWLFDGTRTDPANKGQPLPSARNVGSYATDWAVARGMKSFTSDVADLAYGGLRVKPTALPEKPDSVNFGVMEQHAHNRIHVDVGGNGNMGDPATAALDPIFWLHHANVDRLWNRWLDNNAHQNPDPAAEKGWYDQQFPYYDETGNRVVVPVSEIFVLARHAAKYDDERRVFAALPPVQQEKPVKPKIESVGSIQPALVLGTKPFSKALTVAEDVKPRFAAALATPIADNVEPPVVLLRVEGIKPPEKANLTYEVFVTKKGDNPSKTSYVGPITFFGRGGSGMHGHDMKDGFTQGFDVTDLIQKIRRANNGTLPELEVSVIPHSTTGLSDEELAKQRLEIPISNITMKLVTEQK